MMIRSIRRLAVFVLLAVFLTGLSGCWNPFAPDGGDTKPRDPADYHDRLSPEDVVHNLQTAYEWMDAGEYLDCLSEDFVFYPNEEDSTNDPNIPEFWYKDEETTVHNNMFSDDGGVESISLTLTNARMETLPGQDPIDPLDDIIIYQEGVDLQVNVYGGMTYLATAPSEYRFRVDSDQEGENGEIWWEIFEWYDILEDKKLASNQDPDVERVTLSELKSMFFD